MSATECYYCGLPATAPCKVCGALRCDKHHGIVRCLPATREEARAEFARAGFDYDEQVARLDAFVTSVVDAQRGE